MYYKISLGDKNVNFKFTIFADLLLVLYLIKRNLLMTIDQRTGQYALGLWNVLKLNQIKKSNRVYINNPIRCSSVLTEPSFLI